MHNSPRLPSICLVVSLVLAATVWWTHGDSPLTELELGGIAFPYACLAIRVHRRRRQTGRRESRETVYAVTSLDAHQTTSAQILGGEPGKGFYQMMDGVEVGRVNVAARACGVSMRAFELGIAYAQQRETFGKKIAEHQAVQFRLAEMATKIEAAHQMMVMAARTKDSGRRNDLEAGMAKYLASEYCAQVVEDSFRIHGGYGYSKEYEIERLYRDAPLLLIGEGTSEIQRMVIGRKLLQRHKL